MCPLVVRFESGAASWHLELTFRAKISGRCPRPYQLVEKRPRGREKRAPRELLMVHLPARHSSARTGTLVGRTRLAPLSKPVFLFALLSFLSPSPSSSSLLPSLPFSPPAPFAFWRFESFLLRRPLRRGALRPGPPDAPWRSSLSLGTVLAPLPSLPLPLSQDALDGSAARLLALFCVPLFLSFCS